MLWPLDSVITRGNSDYFYFEANDAQLGDLVHFASFEASSCDCQGGCFCHDNIMWDGAHSKIFSAGLSAQILNHVSDCKASHTSSHHLETVFHQTWWPTSVDQTHLEDVPSEYLDSSSRLGWFATGMAWTWVRGLWPNYSEIDIFIAWWTTHMTLT